MGGVLANGQVLADRCPSLCRPSQGTTNHFLLWGAQSGSTKRGCWVGQEGVTHRRADCILTLIGLGSFFFLHLKKKKLKFAFYNCVAEKTNLLILYIKAFYSTLSFLFSFWFWKKLKHFCGPLKVSWA